MSDEIQLLAESSEERHQQTQPQPVIVTNVQQPYAQPVHFQQPQQPYPQQPYPQQPYPQQPYPQQPYPQQPYPQQPQPQPQQQQQRQQQQRQQQRQQQPQRVTGQQQQQQQQRVIGNQAAGHSVPMTPATAFPIPIPGHGIEEHPLQENIPSVASSASLEAEQVPLETNQSYYALDFFLWISQIVGSGLSSSLGQAEEEEEMDETMGTILIVGLILYCIGLIGSLIRLCCSPTSKYLRNILKDKNASKYVDSFRSVSPKVMMEIECYHYKEDNNHHNRESSHNNTSTKEKVISHRDSKIFAYDTAADYSGNITGLDKYSIAKLELKTEIMFADDYTRQCFCAEEVNFIALNRYRDVYFSYKRIFVIPDLKDRVLTFVDPTKIPFYCNFTCYVLSHFFVLQYPFIMLIRRISTKLVFKYRKTVLRNQR